MAGSMTALWSDLALLGTPVILLLIPEVKSGPLWNPCDHVWSYWESSSLLCVPAASSEQGLCLFKKQEATTLHTGLVFVLSIEACFAVLLEDKHQK